MSIISRIASKLVNKPTLFHGSTTARLGKQLVTGVIEDQGEFKHFFVTTNKKEATEYSLKRAAFDGNGSKPVVVQVETDQEPRNPEFGNHRGFAVHARNGVVRLGSFFFPKS